VGRSLAGGLASAEALASNRNAVTFDGAGVNSMTVDTSSGSRLITAYRVQGEILSTLQDVRTLAGWVAADSTGTPYYLRGRSSTAIGRHGMDEVIRAMQELGAH